jgi:nicotinamidase-related amidase
MKKIFGLEVPTTLPEVCSRDRMALLVYDMQAGIASQIKDADGIVAKVGQVLKAARDARMRIFFTRHMSLPLELMGAFQFRMAMRWQRVNEPDLVKPWLLRDSPGFPIHPSLTPRANEAIFDKITMSAFEGTPLEIALRDCRVSAVAIVGIALEVGIEPTVRHATDLGLIPVVISDACGSGNANATKRSLESLAFEGNALITDVATFTDSIGRASNGGDIDRESPVCRLRSGAE